MKKTITLLLALVLVLGLAGCGSSSSGVTTEKLLGAYNAKVHDTIDAFDVSETADGFSFEKDIVSGTMDKSKNVNYIKFENKGVKCSYFSSESEVLSLIKKMATGNASNIKVNELLAYDCIDQISILYTACLKNSEYSLDDSVKILSSNQPIEMENWVFKVTKNESDNVVTIEATYNK